MTYHRVLPAVLLSLVALGSIAEAKQTAYHALGLQPKDVLSGTILNGKVVPGETKQVVCVASYMTGSNDREDAINVRLGVFDRRGDELVPRYTRDFGSEYGGFVGNGDLELFDLNRDGISEIIVSFESFKEPLIRQRLGEVLFRDDAGFHAAWTGPFEYDATKAARDVPQERRDRFVREIDYANTLRTRGLTLFFNKQMIAVAGERLASREVVQETFPLRGRAGN
ncbi:MAG: hypothetical protein GY716_20795 [bacterium]|nr:hypothetical protein [bacterium]